MPRPYTRRNHEPKRWTPAERRLLEELREQFMPWHDVAERCGHPINSCQSKLTQIEAGRRSARLQRVRSRRHNQAPPTQLPPEAAPIPTGKVVHTATLVQDAELRARIAIQGPNGLLGDPLPGRSALDQRSQPGAGGLSAPIAAAVPKLPAAEPAPYAPRGAGSRFFREVTS